MGLYLIAATGLVDWLIVIFQVAFGLGMVIFVHELGHFLVAKACGVQCDKFYIGFDPPLKIPFTNIHLPSALFKRKWGETEYGIGIIPLGGYVKMLGQDDNPANAAEEMRRAKEGGETLNPRSYLAKSVPQRMAIISAGVIMNVIFAFIFAVMAYNLGVKYTPCFVSGVVPGSPAWQAGIEVGSEIVQVDDTKKPQFRDLRTEVALADMENGIRLVVRPPHSEELRELAVIPTMESGTTSLPVIGIQPAESLRLSDEFFTSRGSPAEAAGFEGGDEIIAVNGQPVKNYPELAALLTAHQAEPITVTVVRGNPSRETNEPGYRAEGSTEVELKVAPRPMKRLGLKMKMGKITAVQAGSPAEKAGLKAGDTISGYDIGDGIRQIEDPLLFPEMLRQLAIEGKRVTLMVAPDGQREDKAVESDLRVPTWFERPFPGSPQSAPALGIAYHVMPHVRLVERDSPAAKANRVDNDKEKSDSQPGIVAQDTIVSASFVPAEGDDSELAKALAKKTIEFGENKPNWPGFITLLQAIPPGTKVLLTVDRGEQKGLQFELEPAAAEGWFNPERGFNLEPLQSIRIATSFGESLMFGARDTKYYLGMVYRFLHKLFVRQIPATALGGPITIAQGAGYSAFDGTSTLLIFLTMLSANLAVVNFLPIPLLDGGHMVLLIYEGIMRRPVSEKFVGAFQLIGFLFIVGLMLFVITLDVGRLAGKFAL